MAEHAIDVLVVGGGPVGLTLACELRRHGATCRVVDQNEAPQVWSKAAAVTPRTLEVLANLGIAERMHERGRPVYGMNVHRGAECLARVDFGIAGTPYPYLLGISQRDTELLLAERLRELGGELERRVRLDEFDDDGDGVTAVLVHHDGKRERVRSRFLVGCDGGKSTVRNLLALPFEGSTFEQNLVQADIKVEFPFSVDPREGVMLLSSNGVLANLPLLSEGRYRVIAPNMPDPDAEATLEMFERIVAQRAPEGTRVSDPAWITKFRFHGRIVPRYRVGQVFLAGDAAHVHSPVGGQGMNMGIQDAVNLAWKLALVVRGAGRPDLLDSYDPERRPVARATVTVTDRATKGMMRMMALRSPIAEALRNQAVSFIAGSGFVGERLFRTVGQLGVDYGDSPIVGEHHVSIWSSDVGPGRDTEHPKVGDWLGWHGRLAPGARVPDVDLDAAVDDAGTLFQLLHGTEHVLFLFDGAAATESGYENLAGIARRVTERYGDHVRVYVVVPFPERPAALDWDGPIVHDTDATLHRHFGASSEGLHLVRPDGYVGFRSLPADGDRLMAYLATIFS